jgi:hypothetical protein
LHDEIARLHVSVFGSHTAVGPGQGEPFVGYVQFAGYRPAQGAQESPWFGAVAGHATVYAVELCCHVPPMHWYVLSGGALDGRALHPST